MRYFRLVTADQDTISICVRRERVEADPASIPVFIPATISTTDVAPVFPTCLANLLSHLTPRISAIAPASYVPAVILTSVADLFPHLTPFLPNRLSRGRVRSDDHYSKCERYDSECFYFFHYFSPCSRAFRAYLLHKENLFASMHVDSQALCQRAVGCVGLKTQAGRSERLSDKASVLSSDNDDRDSEWKSESAKPHAFCTE